RLSDVHVTALDQHRDLTVEERQQQRPYVTSVNISVSHYDYAVIAQLVDVELVAPDSTSERGDERADLGRGEHLVEACLLDIQDFACQRQDRLSPAVPALLGRSTSRVTLDDEDFRKRRIFLLAIRQLAGQASNIQRTFATGHLARLPGGFACPSGLD